MIIADCIDDIDDAIDYKKRIDKALEILSSEIDSGNQSQSEWINDQVCRILLGGCPIVGSEGTLAGYTASPEYQKYVTNMCCGIRGYETYDWNEGSPPPIIGGGSLD